MGLSVGQQLDGLLIDAGIVAAFGVPGGQTLPLYGAAAESGRTHVVMRDERNAACAADAYARVRGTIGVCDATVGPGVTNLVSGLAEAHASGIPVVAVVADIRRTSERFRRRSVASQAAPQREVLAPVTKWIARVEEPRALDELVAHAVRVAVTGRPGPVAIELPEDVFLGPADRRGDRPLSPDDTVFPRFRSAPVPEVLDGVVAIVASARRPVILAGGGVTLNGAAGAVSALATRTGIPVATTINGKGAIDERDDLSIGPIGVFGTPLANAVVRAADVVVAIGTKLDQLSTHTWRLLVEEQRLVHVDVDGEELGRTRRADLPVLADAMAFAVALEQRLATIGHRADRWWGEVAATPPPGTAAGDGAVPPETVVASIDRCLGPEDLLVSDASLSSGWAAAHFHVKRSGVGVIAPRGLAGIGWVPGAAIGARFAADDGRRVVALAGDGAWGYGLAEVETAVRHGLDLTYVVLNNSSLGWIRHAEAQMGLRSNASFGEVDFAQVAQAMGAGGTVVDDVDVLDDVLHGAVRSGGVHVVDVRTSADASPTTTLVRAADGPYR